MRISTEDRYCLLFLPLLLHNSQLASIINVTSFVPHIISHVDFKATEPCLHETGALAFMYNGAQTKPWFTGQIYPLLPGWIPILISCTCSLIFYYLFIFCFFFVCRERKKKNIFLANGVHVTLQLCFLLCGAIGNFWVGLMKWKNNDEFWDPLSVWSDIFISCASWRSYIWSHQRNFRS